MICFEISPGLVERYHKILDRVFDFFSNGIAGGLVLSIIILVVLYTFISNTSSK